MREILAFIVMVGFGGLLTYLAFDAVRHAKLNKP